jgi:predicted SnoaL-like aldol condensation-catalyzing enzyme
MITDHRGIVKRYFELIGAGKYKDGLQYFAPDCKTHNPYIKGNVETLTNAMIAAAADMAKPSAQPDFSVKHLLAEGDLVVAHTELLNSKSRPGQGGLRQAHLFRFEGDNIAEYWDITQQILPSMPNAEGAF